MSITRNIYYVRHQLISFKDDSVALPSCPPNSILYVDGVNGRGRFVQLDDCKIGDNTLIILDDVSTLRMLGEIGNNVKFCVINTNTTDICLNGKNVSKKPLVFGGCEIRDTGCKYLPENSFRTQDKSVINSVDLLIKNASNFLSQRNLSHSYSGPVGALVSPSLEPSLNIGEHNSPIVELKNNTTQASSVSESKPNQSVTRMGLFAQEEKPTCMNRAVSLMKATCNIL